MIINIEGDEEGDDKTEEEDNDTGAKVKDVTEVSLSDVDNQQLRNIELGSAV